MSLIADIFFYNALMADNELVSMVDGRIFNPARPTVDEEEDQVPYIIISLDGGQNESETKDDVEGLTDNVNVSILCVANDRDALGTITEAVRKQVREYFHEQEDEEGTPNDWQFSFSQVAYDPDKPCCFQTLSYQCDTFR